MYVISINTILMCVILILLMCLMWPGWPMQYNAMQYINDIIIIINIPGNDTNAILMIFYSIING